MTKALKLWQETLGKNTTEIVGKFGQFLVAEILDCEIAERGNPELADIFNNKKQFRVEVKTRDNKHSFSIKEMQLGRYFGKDKAVFPIVDTFYALVSYKNSADKDDELPEGIDTLGFSPLSRIATDEERHQYLSEKTNTLYLIDARLVRKLGQLMHTSTGHFPQRDENEGEPMFKIGRRRLKHLFQNLSIEEMSRELQTRPGLWARESFNIERPITIGRRQFSTKYELITVLRKETSEVISPLIRRIALTPV